MKGMRVERVTWWCRRADRLGLTSEPPDEPARRETAQGALVWALRRHVERCPRCRAERAAWARVVALMRAEERVQAPPGMLERVMARIAAERERSRAARMEPVRERARPAPSESWIAAIAVVWSWAALLASASPWFPALMEQAAALVRAGFGRWRELLWDGVAALQRAGEALPLGLEPYVQALWWGTTGCSLAMALVLITGGHRGAGRT